MTKMIFGILALLVFSVEALAATPSDFSPERLQKTILAANKRGEKMGLGDGSELRSLSHIAPNNKAVAHIADYFGVHGINYYGTYMFLDVSIVSENWQIDEKGNWVIDQWIFVGALDGNLKQIMHGMLVEDKDGRVLDIKGFPVGAPTDAPNLEKWGYMLNKWYDWSLAGLVIPGFPSVDP